MTCCPYVPYRATPPKHPQDGASVAAVVVAVTVRTISAACAAATPTTGPVRAVAAASRSSTGPVRAVATELRRSPCRSCRRPAPARRSRDSSGCRPVPVRHRALRTTIAAEPSIVPTAATVTSSPSARSSGSRREATCRPVVVADHHKPGPWRLPGTTGIGDTGGRSSNATVIGRGFRPLLLRCLPHRVEEHRPEPAHLVAPARSHRAPGRSRAGHPRQSGRSREEGVRGGTLGQRHGQTPADRPPRVTGR